MILSCECGEWDGEGWFYCSDNKFTTLQTPRRRRCCSCKELINIEAECIELERFRGPITEVEEKIHGEGGEIQKASWYLCSYCGEHYLNLDAIGYCYNVGDDVREMLKAYHELTGFEPEEK